ncbi:hypothetical protein D9M70_526810 [compost metagenome]
MILSDRPLSNAADAEVGKNTWLLQTILSKTLGCIWRRAPCWELNFTAYRESIMVTLYFVVAAFLYWPFRKWVATAGAPAISALLWPLMLALIIGALIISQFIKNK